MNILSVKFLFFAFLLNIKFDSNIRKGIYTRSISFVDFNLQGKTRFYRSLIILNTLQLYNIITRPFKYKINVNKYAVIKTR